jgi:restriction endonuclease S subunit
MQLRRTLEYTIGGVWGDEPARAGADLQVARVADFDMANLTVRQPVPTMRSIDSSQRNRRLLRRGDLLLEKSGGGDKQNVGRVVQWTGSDDAVCSNFVALLRPAAWCDPRYLVYVHRALYCSGWPNACTKQTTGIQNLDVGAYLSVEVPQVSRRDQEVVAARLDDESAQVEAAIAAGRRLPVLLREALTTARSELIDLNGPTTRLSRVVECLDGRRIPLNREERSFRQGDIPYWGANSIQDYVDDYLFDEALVLVGEDGAPFFDPTRDVAWVIEGRSWVNNHAHVLRPRPGWDAHFLAHVLNVTDYGWYITGATRDKLTQEDMNRIRVPAIDLEQQRAIADRLDRMSVALETATAGERRLRQDLMDYRDAVIHESVLGEPLDDRRGEAA